MKVTKKTKNLKGIALVEVIAALGIAVVVITSLVSLTIFTLRNATQSKLLLEGTKISNREIELVRAYRDVGITWEEFLDDIDDCTMDNPCSMELDASGIIYNPTTQNDGTAEEITRSFSATKPDGTPLEATDDIVRVSVTTRWAVGSTQKSTNVYTDLSNWRSQ